jgi:hypothetical protein
MRKLLAIFMRKRHPALHLSTLSMAGIHGQIFDLIGMTANEEG